MIRDEELTPQQHCWQAEKHIAYARKGRLEQIDIDRLKWALSLMENEWNERLAEGHSRA